MITLSGLQTVVGEIGFAGGYAVRTLIVEERTEKPYRFLAITLN